MCRRIGREGKGRWGGGRRETGWRVKQGGERKCKEAKVK